MLVHLSGSVARSCYVDGNTRVRFLTPRIRVTLIYCALGAVAQREASRTSCVETRKVSQEVPARS